MSENERSVEERSIRVTITCIEAEGLERTTIRRIADIAGVNSAAINYYFRSRERLIRTARETCLSLCSRPKPFLGNRFAVSFPRQVLLSFAGGAPRPPPGSGRAAQPLQ